MPSKNLHHRCEPAVKRLLLTHNRKCSFTHKSSLLLGWQLKHLVENGDSLLDNRQYRVCHNISVKFRQITPPPRQSTLRITRAHVSLDAVRGRTAIVSATKNTRELQEAYRLIVEVDPILQNKEVLKRFIWMASMEDSQPLQLGLFVKLEGGGFV